MKTTVQELGALLIAVGKQMQATGVMAPCFTGPERDKEGDERIVSELEWHGIESRERALQLLDAFGLDEINRFNPFESSSDGDVE